MAFEEIIGQGRATGALRAALASKRLFPSLVFHGPAGAGKLSTALALARALLCPEPERRPHGACRTCRRIDDRALVHPDVRVVFPETVGDFEKGRASKADAEDEGSGADLQERQAEAVANSSWNILIDRIRQSIAFVHRRPAEGAFSLLILDQAHRMLAEAANALLKTLEEPPGHAVLVLTTTSYHALLPTIRSRCQAVPFRPIARADIEAFLAGPSGIDPAEAALRAGLAGGRLGIALALDLEEYRGRRSDLLTMLERLAQSGDAGLAVARAEELVKSGEALEAVLEVLMTLLRDLMVIGAAPGAPLVNGDLRPRLAALAPAFLPRGAASVLDLEEAIDGIRRRGNKQLLVENVLLGLAPLAPESRPSRTG